MKLHEKCQPHNYSTLKNCPSEDSKCLRAPYQYQPTVLFFFFLHAGTLPPQRLSSRPFFFLLLFCFMNPLFPVVSESANWSLPASEPIKLQFPAGTVFPLCFLTCRLTLRKPLSALTTFSFFFFPSSFLIPQRESLDPSHCWECIWPFTPSPPHWWIDPFPTRPKGLKAYLLLNIYFEGEQRGFGISSPSKVLIVERGAGGEASSMVQTFLELRPAHTSHTCKHTHLPLKGTFSNSIWVITLSWQSGVLSVWVSDI